MRETTENPVFDCPAMGGPPKLHSDTPKVVWVLGWIGVIENTLVVDPEQSNVASRALHRRRAP